MELEANIADVDTDEVNKAEEYEAWKGREIARIKRDREEREAIMLKEKRTKWTRVVNEDATDPDILWAYKYNDPIRAKYISKMAAMNAPMAKSKGIKKSKDWESK
ncbi:hypothetical protein SLEP1_g39319 [Rubroshorea leprosula]|uniref:Micro-fibrillar-associated protein 1 C-terminal domain-containing protein n=1 Tax=Rubroshorea leprosula TaxID=152421 RepID=A0AAV5L078_9ROSI|nr:hypothetical protein SLEP1_g39319 [Rubroshorea leprosula]